MKTILIGVIRVYQLTFSMLIGRQCRFEPTCSQYGIESIRRYGACRGGWMTFKRICRCAPWHEGGYDPVPDIELNKDEK